MNIQDSHDLLYRFERFRHPPPRSEVHFAKSSQTATNNSVGTCKDKEGIITKCKCARACKSTKYARLLTTLLMSFSSRFAVVSCRCIGFAFKATRVFVDVVFPLLIY